MKVGWRAPKGGLFTEIELKINNKSINTIFQKFASSTINMFADVSGF
jgi:hypothetical protein